jgi:5-methylcytosine-specific restriction endonuclease McrA
MPDDIVGDSELPAWDSEIMKRLFPNIETRGVYRVLFETRDDPLGMMEVRERVSAIIGQANAQTDRRARDLRSRFEIRSERVPGARNEFRYRLVGWRTDAAEQSSRTKLPPKVEAAVYSSYGARCAWCGRSPQADQVRLAIDHKIPLHVGGTNDIDNLQVLCVEHNHAKQAMFAEFDTSAPVLKAVFGLPEPHLRIGELLKAMEGRYVPVDLINLVAREENRGDPTRRMRELRSLGWVIGSTRRKEGRRTVSYYVLEHWEPWPPEGPRAAVARAEAERKRRKRGK